VGVREHRVALCIAAGLALVVALGCRCSWVGADDPVRASRPHRARPKGDRPSFSADPAPRTHLANAPASPSAFPELGELCNRFRALRGPTVETGTAYFWEFEWPAVTRLEIDTQQVEVSMINGGFGLASGARVLPLAADARLVAEGIPVRKLKELATLAQEAAVLRMEWWPLVISDDYHGQPGLVVRDDVAVRRDATWWVCLDERTVLLQPDAHSPLRADFTCEPADDAEYWWRCAEKAPRGDGSASE
jgi:hypothetical protein